MTRDERALVSEIKTAYKAEKQAKLTIQRDMVALRDEHGWTVRQIADATEIPKSTVDQWLAAADEVSAGLSEVGRLTPKTQQAASDLRVAARVLKSGDEQELRRVVASLPRERRQAIAAAAGSGHAQAREQMRQEERGRSERERQETTNTITRPAREAVAGFAGLGIVGHLEQARDEIHELIEDGSLTPKLVRSIGRALEGIEAEMQVARGLVGLEE